MKKQFFVCEDYTANSTSYSDIGRVIKRFKHQNEAIGFIENEKNIQQYNGLTLYYTNLEGLVYRWDDHGSWELMSCG